MSLFRGATDTPLLDVCTISLRFRYFSQIQIWTPGNLIIAGIQPGNAVNIQTICYCFYPGI